MFEFYFQKYSKSINSLAFEIQIFLSNLVAFLDQKWRFLTAVCCQKIQFLNLILVMDGQALKDVPNACRHNKSQFDITNIPFSGTKNNVC